MQQGTQAKPKRAPPAPNPSSNRSRNKDLLVTVKEIRDVLAGIYDTDPQDILICDSCIRFASVGGDAPDPFCFIVQHDGQMPPKGYCKRLAIDPAKDPRKWRVLQQLLARLEEEKQK